MKNQGFLYKFPLNQSIDTWERKFEEAYPARVPKPPSIDPLGPARFYAIILQGGYNCPARVGRLRSWTWLVQTFDDLRILPYITLW